MRLSVLRGSLVYGLRGGHTRMVLSQQMNEDDSTTDLKWNLLSSFLKAWHSTPFPGAVNDVCAVSYKR